MCVLYILYINGYLHYNQYTEDLKMNYMNISCLQLNTVTYLPKNSFTACFTYLEISKIQLLTTQAPVTESQEVACPLQLHLIHLPSGVDGSGTRV